MYHFHSGEDRGGPPFVKMTTTTGVHTETKLQKRNKRRGCECRRRVASRVRVRVCALTDVFFVTLGRGVVEAKDDVVLVNLRPQAALLQRPAVRHERAGPDGCARAAAAAAAAAAADAEHVSVR